MGIKIIKNKTNVQSLYSMIDEMSNYDINELDYKNIVLVKDNFSLTVEKDVLMRLGDEGTFNVDVLSFTRLLNKISDETISKTYLSSMGGSLLVSKIILENADKFLCYKGSNFYPEFASKMHQLLLKLKGAGVTPQELVCGSSSRLLENKLHDISLIYREYESVVQSFYYDETTKVDLLCKAIDSSDLIAKSNVFFTSFDSYSLVDYKVLYAICKKAKNVIISSIYSENNKIYDNQNYNQITNALSSLELDYTVVNNDSVLLEVNEHINKNLYNYSKCDKLATDKIEIYEANDVFDETEKVAKNILNHVRMGGRFEDLAIVCQDFDRYNFIFERIFKSNDIPYYMPINPKMHSHESMKFLSALLSRNKLAKDYVAIAKNYFSGIDFESSCKYENYLLKYGVNYKKLNSELVAESYDFKVCSSVHNRVNEIISMLKFKKIDSVKTYIYQIKKFLQDYKFNDKLESLAQVYEDLDKEVQSFTLQISDKISAIFDQIEIVYGDSFITFDDFNSVLASGLNSITISVIPMSNDCVTVGSINDMKFFEGKKLFIIGASEGNIPTITKDVELLSIHEIIAINNTKLNEISIEKKNKQDKFNCFLVMHNFRDKLYISYSRLDDKGSRAMVSPLINYVNSIVTVKNSHHDIDYFGSIESRGYPEGMLSRKSCELEVLQNINDLLNNGDNHYKYISSLYKAIKDDVDTSHLTQGLTDNLNLDFNILVRDNSISSTAIESFYKCPYMHYMDKGLKLKEREEHYISSIDTGNFLHKVLEEYSKKCNEIRFDKSVSDKVVEEIASTVKESKDYKKLTANKLGVNELNLLVSEAKNVCYHVLKQHHAGIMREKLVELNFSDNGMLINDLKLVGKIDRVDIKDNFVNIIDYKTGSVIDQKIEKLFYGMSVQLPLYSKQLEHQGYKSIGQFYFPVHNEFSSEAEKDYKLIGRVVDNNDYIEMIDKNIETKSDIINITNGKNGYSTRTHNYLVTEGVYDSINTYALKVSENATSHIKRGYIKPSPMGDVCKYCKFKNMCKFELSRKKCRASGGKITAETFYNIINGEEE